MANCTALELMAGKSQDWVPQSLICQRDYVGTWYVVNFQTDGKKIRNYQKSPINLIMLLVHCIANIARLAMHGANVCTRFL